MAEQLQVKSRQADGKRIARRLRSTGEIPAVLYGHGEASVSLALSASAFATALRHGSRVVELQGAVSEKALIREVQWDTYGIDVLHVDFTRVSEHERVHVEVKIETKGKAPGQADGGVVELLLHEIEIECEALSIPEKIVVNLGGLTLGAAIHAGDIELPAGMTLLSDAETVVVHCVKPMEAKEGAEGGAAAEPEVIGRKAGEEGEAEEE